MIVLTKNLWASGREGHGGIVHVCKAEKDQETIELLDFKEGKDRLKLHYVESKDSVNDILASALKRLETNPKYASVLSKVIDALKWIRDPRNQIKTNLSEYLLDPRDYNLSPIQDEKCSYHVIGYMGGDNLLRIDSKLLSLLSNTKIAGFFLHEAVAMVARKLTGAKFTDEARLFVALMMSVSTDSDYLRFDESFHRTFIKNYVEDYLTNKFLINVQYLLPHSRKNKKNFKKNVKNDLRLELSTVDSSGELAFYHSKSSSSKGKQDSSIPLDRVVFFKVFENEVQDSFILTKDLGNDEPIVYLRRAWINSASGKFKYKIILDGVVMMETVVKYTTTTDKNGEINPWYLIDIEEPGYMWGEVNNDNIFNPYPIVTIKKARK